MSKLYTITLLVVVAYGQVDWEVEVVDSMVFTGNEFNYTHVSSALDNNGIPHVVYNKFDRLFYATKTGASWQEECIDSSLFYTCFDLLFDADNIAHLSYYRKDDAFSMTYLCYAYRDTLDWTINVVDSIYGIVTNYWFVWEYYKTSLALDTLDLPGIAYTSWNLGDSLHYIKYAKFNGAIWDTSVIEYDSIWSPHTTPSDWSPCLRFCCDNKPMIAFHQIYDNPQDTIKLACYDDTLHQWIIEPVICDPYGGASISLALNSQDNPCLAHGMSTALAYSWQESGSWYTEYTGTDIGWLNIGIALALDFSDNPHILYHPNGPVYYCFKRNSIWHLCGRIDSSLNNLGDVCLNLDVNNEPHICFGFHEWDSIVQAEVYGIKYGKGVLTGIEEDLMGYSHGMDLKCVPDIVTGEIRISFVLEKSSYVSLMFYDACGRNVMKVFNDITHAGFYVQKIDLSPFSAGVYFVQLTTSDQTTTTKVVKVK